MPDNRIDEIIAAFNYRLTKQRKAILSVMRENRGCHLTAEEVLLQARQKVPNIGIATIYRTLERLVAMQVLYKELFDGDKYRYEISDLEDHQHHHIICLACKEIFEVEESLLNDLEHHLEQRGFEIVDHQLKIYAYCPQCRARKE